MYIPPTLLEMHAEARHIDDLRYIRQARLESEARGDECRRFRIPLLALIRGLRVRRPHPAAPRKAAPQT